MSAFHRNKYNKCIRYGYETVQYSFVDFKRFLLYRLPKYVFLLPFRVLSLSRWFSQFVFVCTNCFAVMVIIWNQNAHIFFLRLDTWIVFICIEWMRMRWTSTICSCCRYSDFKFMHAYPHVRDCFCVCFISCLYGLCSMVYGFLSFINVTGWLYVAIVLCFSRCYLFIFFLLCIIIRR